MVCPFPAQAKWECVIADAGVKWLVGKLYGVQILVVCWAAMVRGGGGMPRCWGSGPQRPLDREAI